jgi:hypothetical protein
MKEICSSNEDPISLDDWCDISPKSYVFPGVINPKQCYNLETLVRAIETRLSAGHAPVDPITNTPLTGNQLIQIAAQHVVNGFELPSLMSQRVQLELRRTEIAPTVPAKAPRSPAGAIAGVPRRYQQAFLRESRAPASNVEVFTEVGREIRGEDIRIAMNRLIESGYRFGRDTFRNLVAACLLATGGRLLDATVLGWLLLTDESRLQLSS